MVGLILMPPRFRASDFSQIADTNHVCEIETGFSCEVGCGDGARAICLFARVAQPLDLWTQKIQANIHYCCCVCAAKRHAE